MLKPLLAFVALFAVALSTAQTTVLPKTTILPNTTILGRAAAATNTFTLVVANANFFCSGSTTCNVTVASTGTGHLLVVAANTSNNNWVTAASGAGSWTVESTSGVGCAENSSGAVTGCAYNLSSTSGVTTIVLTLNNTNSLRGVVREYSFTQGSCSRDTSNFATNTPSAGTVNGATLTLTGTSDVIVQWETENNTTAIGGSYVDFEQVSNAGWADKLNTASGTAPAWTVSTTNGGVQAGIAFK